jgi:hypothetical protein
MAHVCRREENNVGLEASGAGTHPMRRHRLPSTLLAGLLLPALLCAVPPAAAAGDVAARCKVTSAGVLVFSGSCRFGPETGGTFSIASPAGEGVLYEGISIITVVVVAPGEADVFGLTSAGINSRWGPARRSTADPACWTGSDFEICAY